MSTIWKLWLCIAFIVGSIILFSPDNSKIKQDVPQNSTDQISPIAGTPPIVQYDPGADDYWVKPYVLLILFCALACLCSIWWLKRENWI